MKWTYDKLFAVGPYVHDDGDATQNQSQGFYADDESSAAVACGILNKIDGELIELKEVCERLLIDLNDWPSIHEGGDYLHAGMTLKLRMLLGKQY